MQTTQPIDEKKNNPMFVRRAKKNFALTVPVPGSKSLTNRALLIASLANGRSALHNVLNSIDSRLMLQACKALGAEIHFVGESSLEIDGMGFPQKEILTSGKKPTEIYIENAGTAARFLTAVLTTGHGAFLLRGNQRMQEERPIEDLVVALKKLGAKLSYIKKDGFLPLEIIGGDILEKKAEIEGQKSSQYISALLLAAPFFADGLELSIKGPLVSKTYVKMTLSIMEKFGVHATHGHSNFSVPHSQYNACNYTIETDASSASYFFAAAAICRSRITVPNLAQNSTQGDLGFVRILEHMGCKATWNDSKNAITIEGAPLKGVRIDMNTMSDVAPTLAVVACFADSPTCIENVGNMRIKECDRIHALFHEISKTGTKVIEKQNGLEIHPTTHLQGGVTFSTYDDHRMAMSLSLFGLLLPGIKIEDPQCVGKTYPQFFEHLRMLQTEL